MQNRSPKHPPAKPGDVLGSFTKQTKYAKIIAEREVRFMRILAIGDIVGESGIKKLREILPTLRKNENIDFIIANGENTAEGMGITSSIFKELLALGINVITMGNHTWGKKDIFSFIDHKQLIRPANYPEGVQGRGYDIYECQGKKICVINLIGRTDMNVLSENPFIIGEKIINEVKNKTDLIIVDFHAEATAEKIAFGYFVDGKASIVFGTHTHVQTADEKVLENGTAYITDIGMTGPKKSVIGMALETSIKRFVTTLPEKYKVAEGEAMFNGCIFDVDGNGKVKEIKRVVL